MIYIRKGPLHKNKICAAVLFLYSSFPANYPFCFSFPAIHAAIRSTSSFGVLSAYRSPFVSCKEYGHIIIPASFVPQDTKAPSPAKWNVRHSGQKKSFPARRLSCRNTGKDFLWIYFITPLLLHRQIETGTVWFDIHTIPVSTLSHPLDLIPLFSHVFCTWYFL